MKILIDLAVNFALVALASWPSSGFAGETPTGKPLFTFVQFNDTHVVSPDSKAKRYEKANEKVMDTIEAINRERQFPLPDFVILSGDIINGGYKEILATECEFAVNLLMPLRCPWYPLVGNHEVVQEEGNPNFQGTYDKFFGAEHVNYDFMHKGMHFICLNDSGCRGGGDAVSDKRNAWLKDVLEHNPNAPKIVVCHIPLVSLREEAVLKKSFRYPTYKLFDNGTKDTIEAHADKIVAVLCGHLHLTGAVEERGIWHICPSGTASYPCDYARYSVYGDRIEVEMLQVSKELITPKTNFHGPPRCPQGFTDRCHATPEEYVCGTATERRFTIQLPAGKRLDS